MSWKDSLGYKIKRYNPYEYLGPLTKSHLFIDRTKELEDSFLVCDRVVSGSVGGLFIIGSRASGKTTFLNKLNELLTIEGIPTIQIPLDESMTHIGNEDKLFRTMMDLSIIKLKELEFISTSTKDKLLNFIRGLGELDTEIQIPGINLLVKWKKKEEVEPLQYFVLKESMEDLLNLMRKEEEIDNGLIFLFDEGDLFMKNKNLLEILRNVFQDTPRIGLVITGTYKLIDDISEIFSPIPRFFKKIILGPYPNDNDMYEAIDRPFKYVTKKFFEEEKLLLKGHFKIFNKRIADLTRRMPMEINLLCNYAFDYAAERLKRRESVIELYFSLNKEILDECMKQLRGTKGYSEFVSSLNSIELRIMTILSNSIMEISSNELSILTIIDRLEDSLLDEKIENIIKIITEDKDEIRKNIDNILENIMKKSDEFLLNAVSKTALGHPIYSINDEWVASYFKIGEAKRMFDLEKGMIPILGGVVMFRDPISSIIHSIFFSRLAEPLRGKSKFKVSSRKGTSRAFRAPKGNRQYLIIDFIRTADNQSYYYIFSLRRDYILNNIKQDILYLFKKLKEWNIIKRGSVSTTSR